MAEVCRLENQRVENKLTKAQDENFCVLNVLCVFISLVTILADLATDILILVEYCNNGFMYWALPTFMFILVPNIVTNLFSNRWISNDQKSNLRFWISHIFLVGILERYITFLHKAFICKNFESMRTQALLSQRNDLSLLHFLYIFTGTVPQVILQSYAIVYLEANHHTKVFALVASFASIFWGCASYIYSIVAFSSENFKWSSFILKLVWHFSTLLGRIPSILLLSIIFGIWTLIPIGLHWAAMTFWIIIQKTTFCLNKVEETLYNVVMGFVYCFCYINVKEGPSRCRLFIFYSITVTQNFGILFLYYVLSDIELQKRPWSITAAICVFGGTIIGVCAMILYYRYFHFNGPLHWRKGNEELELNNKDQLSASNTAQKDKLSMGVRTFKSLQKDLTGVPNSDDAALPDIERVTNRENNSADKKYLLDHWIARSGTPAFSSAPVSNDVSSIEFYTVENTPQPHYISSHNSYNGHIKRHKTIFSPTELNLKLSAIDNLESSIDEITTSKLNIQKRRGICSSDQLRNDLPNINLEGMDENFIKSVKNDHSSVISQDTDGSNKKTSSDSIDMDLDLSFSDINSSDINNFNENIVQKLCLSALKNIKVGNQDADIENIQRIALDILKEMYTKKGKGKGVFNNDSFVSKQRDLETPTEMLSVHDYENICAVNIAREAWGLRSWNGYSDIENWLHDGSVVRDRRCDTLTSGSSEISSCLSQELKNAILSAPSFPKKTHTYSNVFVKFERTNQDEYSNAVMCHTNDDTFLAKPCLIDNVKDLSHLEPILEELDDFGDKETPVKKRMNSESSLVATIDEIRKGAENNSPRNLYHRRELAWHSPFTNTSDKIETNLKRALWKEPSKFDPSNIMESLPEKENIVAKLNDENASKMHRSDDINYLSSLSNTKVNRYSSTSTNQDTKIYNKNLNNNPEQNLQDFSNKDIDLLWQIYSVHSIPHHSAEDLSVGKISSSLQSLIQKDVSSNIVTEPVTKVNNMKKAIRNRPKRKFSILRERFEPRLNSDEEILCHHPEPIPHHDSAVIRDKNIGDTIEKQKKLNMTNLSNIT